MTGQTISHYRIVEKLGEGGMGVVYQAEDTKLQRTVALKFLPAQALDDPERKARFLREARAAAALNHPNICTVHEIDEERGFLAMEHVEGETLKDRIASGPLPLRDVFDIAVQIATGLEEAHQKGIVHRDLKSANVMTTRQRQVKIMDFGLAQWTGSTRLTKTGSSSGTPGYMAPEQFRGEVVDRRADIWALGVVIYEMVSGRLPFAGATDAAMMYSALETKPEPLTGVRTGVPVALDRVIAKLLAKDPADRYQHAADAAVDLRALREGTKPAAAHRRPVWVYALAALSVVAGGYFFYSREPRTPAPPSPSQYEQITAFNDAATQPAISADGRMVTFLRGPGTFVTPGQVYVKMLPSGEPVRLTNDALAKMSPVFSPDGSRIAYTVVTHGLGQWDTWVVPTLGGPAKPWLGNASGLVWTAPGRLLFSEVKHGVHMAIVTASETRTDSRDLYLPDDMRGMMHRSFLSPDGKSVLGVEMDRNGWIPCRLLPAEENSPGRVVGPAPGECRYAAWSPDGQWMYFSSDSSGNQQIWRQRFPEGAPEQLTSGPAQAEGIAVAPDGRSLITSIGINQSSVWVHRNGVDTQVSPEGDAILPYFGDGFPGWIFSPEGTKLYYLA